MITKAKRLENSTPKFSGNTRNDVDDWLFKVQQGFISANIEEEKKLNAIVNFVSDLPLLILKKHIESQSNWISLENELKSTFRIINRDRKIRSELISLKNREGLSIENYVRLKESTKKGTRMSEFKKFSSVENKNKNEKIISSSVSFNSDDLESDKIYVLNDPSSEKKIPSIIDRNEGISMKIGLDSGATHSVMNQMTAISNKFEILRTYKRIKTATCIISEASGVTKPVEVDIGRNECISSFLIMMIMMFFLE
ncbi:hypothetical protein BpHYR1_016950 [Brachionus plicatilis]|uniref:Uncharacterized protein n=1 Tax=Brachionus plicatilis TaxID=10195 RepID=A0A3M7SS68_BRAPC|nr:hypothetical protein BpHYR1_016950 [Brachionus plicatilis]